MRGRGGGPRLEKETHPVRLNIQNLKYLRIESRALKVTELTTSRTPKKIGPDLIKSILKEAGGPLTTRELQNEVRKVTSFCPSSSVVGLNVLRKAL